MRSECPFPAYLASPLPAPFIRGLAYFPASGNAFMQYDGVDGGMRVSLCCDLRGGGGCLPALATHNVGPAETCHACYSADSLLSATREECATDARCSLPVIPTA